MEWSFGWSDSHIQPKKFVNDTFGFFILLHKYPVIQQPPRILLKLEHPLIHRILIHPKIVFIRQFRRPQLNGPCKRLHLNLPQPPIHFLKLLHYKSLFTLNRLFSCVLTYPFSVLTLIKNSKWSVTRTIFQIPILKYMQFWSP